MKKLLIASIVGLSLVAATIVPASATERCNSGRGNLSENVVGIDKLVNPHLGETGPGDPPTTDCDPGNSGGVNSGGD